MPPKEVAGAAPSTVKDGLFLATCFKHLKQRPQVDATAVAAELKLSKGGVENKLRPIIKAFEGEGATWLKEHFPVSKQAGSRGVRSKAKTAENQAENNQDNGRSDGRSSSNLKRKAKANAVGVGERPSSAIQLDDKSTVAEVDQSEAIVERPTPGKKIKAALDVGIGDSSRLDAQIKKEEPQAE